MEWATKLREEGIDLAEVGVMDEEARLTFRTAVAILGTDEQQALLDTRAVKVLSDESFGLEVAAIIPSTQLTREMYACQNRFTVPKICLQPLGMLVCRPFHVKDFNEYDLPKDKYPNGRVAKTVDDKRYEFWVEDHVLEECFVGMKLNARILTLEDGLTILDDVRETMCSFYKWLPNELWMNRHPKEVVIRKKDVDEESVDGGGDVVEEKFADDESVHGS
jgi:hypothetical protein